MGRLRAQVSDSLETSLLNEEEIDLLRGDLLSSLKSEGNSYNPSQAPGQPLALDLLKGCLHVTGDVRN